jgi:class 3 adenylate cyclase
MHAWHRYQFKLEGFDPDWVDAGTRNSAIYTNLNPGTYTFFVRGDNADGIWGGSPTSFQLEVRPPWWMTTWFYGGCVLLLLSGFVFYTNRLRRQKATLERTVTLRTTELRQEKDRSDDLLHNILPAEVSAELKAKGHAEARYFQQATILLSDFKDFSALSERMRPAELVEELDSCFKAFDDIMERYRIEKIKTIGDAYMAAGGLPDPQQGPPRDVVSAALEMQVFMAQRKAERHAQGKPFFEMRIGIHTGPVVAGIVGVKKFAYDIWGDAVGIAERMESDGEVGRVNISGSTHALVRDGAGLAFTSRGKVQTKGKGELEMFFVHRGPDIVGT